MPNSIVKLSSFSVFLISLDTNLVATERLCVFLSKIWMSFINPLEMHVISKHQ